MGKTRRAEESAEFEDFTYSRGQRLFRTALLLCGDWHLAEDLTQVTLAKLFAAWPKVRRADNQDAYARGTLVRSYLSHRRLRRSGERPALGELRRLRPGERPAVVAGWLRHPLPVRVRLTPRHRRSVQLRLDERERRWPLPLLLRQRAPGRHPPAAHREGDRRRPRTRGRRAAARPVLGVAHLDQHGRGRRTGQGQGRPGRTAAHSRPAEGRRAVRRPAGVDHPRAGAAGRTDDPAVPRRQPGTQPADRRRAPEARLHRVRPGPVR
ncbi:hypothetical protein CP971_22435 [Streptomyces viridifaciens]|nr:hypothetical protein CP971_22435 [Streptomyces viridifaciens]